MIRFKNISRKYEENKGIFDFSLEVEEGEVFGLLGPSGCGKTTALRVLMGFEKPTKGRCAINGKDCLKDSLSLHKTIGYLPENVILPSELTGRQFLTQNAKMRGCRNLGRIFDLAGRFKLNVDKKIGTMTSNEKKQTGIICAMLHDPQILFLDRPYENLDPKSRSTMMDLILAEKERNHMVILTAKGVDEVDLTCDRVGLLDRGYMIYMGEIEDLRENMYRDYVLQFRDPRSVIRFVNEGFETKNMKDRNVIVTVKGELKPLIEKLASYDITNIEPVPTTLEETFVHIYGGRIHV